MSAPDVSMAARVRASRWIVMGAGAVSILMFFVMPLIDARVFTDTLLRPAYGVPPGITADAGGLAGPQREILELVESEVVEGASWTPTMARQVGARMTADFSGDEGRLAAESAMVGRFLQLLACLYLGVGVLALVLPVVRGPDSVVVNGVVGGSALLLLATHVLTVGMDVIGVVEGALFAWPSHLATFAIIIALGVGTGMVLTPRSALRVVATTLGVFVVAAVGSALYVV